MKRWELNMQLTIKQSNIAENKTNLLIDRLKWEFIQRYVQNVQSQAYMDNWIC